MIQEADIQGISTPSVDDLVKALGREDVSKSHVSRLCGETDERVHAFPARPIEGDQPCIWPDTTCAKVRRDHRRRRRQHGRTRRLNPAQEQCSDTTPWDTTTWTIGFDVL